jgi:outer membrane protein TolC
MQVRVFSRSLFQVVFSLGLALASVNPASSADNSDFGDKVKGLLKKRHDMRSEILDRVAKEYKGGQCGYDQLLQAEKSLLSAKLDLCETKDERVEVYKQMVKAAERGLRAVELLAKAKEVGEVDVLKARVHLIETEIGLERAMASK